MDRALPQELIDRIIDFLHPDKHTLYACALTHPTFLPCSRHHLFYSLTVPKPQSHRANRLAAVLTAAPELFALVRELRVQSGNLILLRTLIEQQLCSQLRTLAVACANVLELAATGSLVHVAHETMQKLYISTGSLHARTVTGTSFVRTACPPD
jgi:hypothetical protein